MGRSNMILRQIDVFLQDNIDEMFYLNNVEHYLWAIGVRGHHEILKRKARDYLLDEANKVI